MQRRRVSVSDLAYEALKQNIIEFHYSPGQALREEQLTEEIAVSRTPLRQALYRLELEGLIVKKANGRMEVQALSIEEAVDIFAVREALEGLVAKEAAMRASSEAVTAMREALLHMAEADERFTSITYGSRFHHLLYEHASPTAVQFLNQLNSRLERYRRLSGYRHPDYTIDTPVSEHEKILAAIEQKDGPAAEHYMRTHIQRSLASTKETLEFHISSF